MTNKSQSAASSGIGFTGLLTIAFIVLKLCKVIDWSWWWALSPVLFEFAIIFVCLIWFAVVHLITAVHNGRRKKRCKF